MFVEKVSIPRPHGSGGATFFLRFLQQPVLRSVEKVSFGLVELVVSVRAQRVHPPGESEGVAAIATQTLVHLRHAVSRLDSCERIRKLRKPLVESEFPAKNNTQTGTWNQVFRT